MMRQTALITGATSGIGEACARKFAEGGYDIIITGRKAERLENLKSELEAKGTGVKVLVFDVRNADEAEKAVMSLNCGWDRIDVAFYAASAPKHVQIAEVLVLATHQANGTVIVRK